MSQLSANAAADAIAEIRKSVAYRSYYYEVKSRANGVAYVEGSSDMPGIANKEAREYLYSFTLHFVPKMCERILDPQHLPLDVAKRFKALNHQQMGQIVGAAFEAEVAAHPGPLSQFWDVPQLVRYLDETRATLPADKEHAPPTWDLAVIMIEDALGLDSNERESLDRGWWQGTWRKVSEEACSAAETNARKLDPTGCLTTLVLAAIGVIVFVVLVIAAK